jgi:hypothetical protein
MKKLVINLDVTYGKNLLMDYKKKFRSLDSF